MKTPCANCPWRKDAPIADWQPERFIALWENCQDDGMAMMSCHKSKPGKDIICAGFAIVVGFQSIGLRLAAIQGTFCAANYSANGAQLFESFEEMIRAQGIEPPARNNHEGRRRCRQES